MLLASTRRSFGTTIGGALLALALALAAPRVASALYLDEAQNFSLRMRAYSQLTLATQDSQKYVTSPEKFTGQMMQHRSFANPEFEAELTSFLPRGWLDELSGRLAVWGFYDGLYDYGPAQYGDIAADIKFHRGPNGAYQTKGDTREQALDGNGLARNVRDIYAHRIRVNEAYVNVSKGPLFVRIGRQAISWGEADTIGLLDANNPFDMRFGNSRWGVRLQTVIARDYTTSVWFYKTFPTDPVAINLGISSVTGRLVTSTESPLINVAGVATTFFSELLDAIVRAEVEVFNNQPGFRVNTNITPGLSAECNAPGAVKNSTTCGFYDQINLIRGELGFDRNIFIRALNPATSFVWVNALVFTANPDETKFKDYRASGLIKPSAIIRAGKGGPAAGSQTQGCDGQPGPCDYVNQSVFEWFIQSHIESSWMHCRLPVGMTAVATGRGALLLMPDVAYRVSDAFILSARYINIHTFGSENNGFTPGPGVFRDRDEVWLRATYQLN